MKNVEDIYPLSPMQQLMLVHALSAAGGVLHEQLSCTLEGELDAAALRRAWESVVARHGALRTAFAWEGLKKPVQVVRRDVALPWYQHDWRHLPPAEQAEQPARLLRADREEPFDLTQPPLLRLHLARAADKQWFFLWSCHHLVTDGWCLGLVLGEVFTAYEALRQGRAVPLPPARPFRDYIAWLLKQDTASVERWWRNYLGGYAAPLKLPLDGPSEASPAAAADGSGRGAGSPAELPATPPDIYREHRTKLTRGESADLAALAAARRWSQSTIIQAAWAMLLGRYAGEEEVVFGATVSGRPPDLAGVESIVGPFTNNVPVRVRLEPDAQLAAWLDRLQAAQYESGAYEHAPPDQVQRWSELPAGCRLFDTLVVFENQSLYARSPRLAGGLELREVSGTASAGFPLALVAVPGTALELRLRFDTREFDSQAVSRMLGHLATLLRAIIASPHARLRELPLVTEQERLQIETAWAPAAGTQPAVIERAGGPVARAAIRDVFGQPAPVGVPGELVVQDAAALGPSPQGEWRSTGQAARWKPCGQVELLGRLDAPLRIGVYRVDGEEVAAVLREHPFVREAAVQGRRDQLGNLRLVAYVSARKEAMTIVDANQQVLMLGELRSHVRKRLGEASTPSSFVAVESLPRTPQGQVDEAALPPPTRPRPDSAGPYLAPRDVLEAKLARIWADVLGVQPVGVTDRFSELGGHSTMAVCLMVRIEEEFGRKLPLVALFQQPTIEHLADLLRRDPGAFAQSCLVPIRPGDARWPVFCVHPAGGTVFCYLELARYLDPQQPLYGLQAQGVDGELPPHKEVGEMAACYIQAMRARQPQGPYQICGWSSGGIIAYELARQLQEQGQKVGLLALFDAAVPDPDHPFTEEDFLPMLLLLFPGESREEIERLQRQSPDEQVAYFRQRAEMAQLVMATANPTQAKHVFEVFQANVTAMVAYKPKPFGGKITLFRASETATPMHEDRRLGWGRWAREIEVIDVPGDHVTMFRPPTIEILARRFQECLDRLAAPEA